MNGDLPAAIRDAVLEWLDDNEPLSRAEFDRRNSALMRTVGEAAEHPEYGRNQHLRATDAQAVGLFAYEHDVALAELDDDVEYVDLHGYAVDDGYVPVLICLAGAIEDVAERQHQLYHLVDDTSPCECRAVTDGGTVDRETIARYIDNHPTADRWEVLTQLSIPPNQQDLVDELLEETSKDIADTGSSDDADQINHNETCVAPYCDNPRTNPHPDSLCEEHLDRLGGDRGQHDLESSSTEPSTDSGSTCDHDHDHAPDRDLLAEARAIVDEKPDVPIKGIDDAEPSAAAFMGGTDSPFASSKTPDPTPSSSAGQANYERAVSALPLRQLDALPPADRRRAARKRGLEWPTTDEARDLLEETIFDVMRNEDDRIIDAPTSLGKSYTIAATRWGARDEITGDRPVVHLSQTRDARDEAVETAREHGGEHFVLQSRHEACPVAAGDHDPDPEGTNENQVITIDGQPASEWIQDMCDGRGLPFSAVHRHLEEHNDQVETLPCCRGTNTTYDEEEGDFEDGEPSECPAIHQWDEWRNGDHPLVIATHNFAHVPGLRQEANVIFDEGVDFAAELSTDRVRRAVGAYLREIDATVTTWESFIGLALHDAYGTDAAIERDELQNDLNSMPDREWYFENPDAHTLAPALARAIFNADERASGRRYGKTPYQPPRLDAEARDDDGWNREWVSVVLDDTNEIQTVRTVPDLSQARSVIGLDAHPSIPNWQANTLPWIDSKLVLQPEERQLWRRYERGLRVIQMGDATRPLASGEYFDSRGCEAVLEHLHDEYGDDFRTAITASSVEDRLEGHMRHVGVHDPETMHYGEEKSRNDFADEPIGFVNGSIDPGDDFIINLIAELDLDAEPERSEGECDHCEGDGCHECAGTGHCRAHGRGFVGEDADVAAEILASVRENHTAQAAGRYARNPDDPSSTATVFVRTDAMPPGFADIKVPGAEWVYTTDQQTVVEALREHAGSVTAYEISQDVDVSKRTVQRVLKRLVEHGSVQALERAGLNGATLYRDDGTPNAGVVDLKDEDGEVTTDLVWGSYTWTVAIEDVDVDEPRRSSGSNGEAVPSGGIYQWVDPPDGG